MKKSILLLVAGGLIGLALVGMAFLTITPNTKYLFSGQLTFNSEQDYINFKVAMSDTDIQKAEVLSSYPPIIVNFETEATKSFPYGERSTLPPGYPFTPLFGFGLGLIVAVGLIAIFEAGMKESAE